MKDKKKQRKFIIAAILLTLVLVEGTVRVLYTFRDQIVLRVYGKRSVDLNLNPYQYPDPNNPTKLWRLKPGFSQTIEQAITSKEQTGRILTAKQLQKNKSKSGKKIIFQINKDGFKGPEIDKTHSKTRILTLGDSCTFGTLFDSFSYPRSLERALENKKLKCEVINGGVEGYSPRHILMRIEEYKALKPEIVTLYIGWNAIYSQVPFPDTSKNFSYSLSNVFYTYRLVRSLYNRFTKPKFSAIDFYKKPKNPNKNDPLIKKLEGYNHPAINKIEQIIQSFPKSQVVLVTLPGLYTLHPPTEKALKIGHLPQFTDNPYVIAKMTIEYNKSLRKLAQKYKLLLIDLEKWGLETLNPRHSCFMDAVHLTEQKQKMAGEYMAEKLFPLLKKQIK